MICPRCGTSLPDESRFCKTCGSRIEQPAPTQPQPSESFDAWPMDQVPAAPQMPPAASRNRSTRTLLIAACVLTVAVIGLLAYILFRGNGIDYATDPNGALASSYESILDKPQKVDYLQESDPSAYELTGKYQYFLIDLRNDGLPDLVMVADCVAHASSNDVPCTLARVMVYNEATHTTEATGSTIKAGGGTTMDVAPDYHSICTVKVNESTGEITGKTYNLADASEADNNPTQTDAIDLTSGLTPNLLDTSDHTLVDKLRNGTWTDSDAVA